MNFEGRYLIRWGIPGWTLLICLFINLLIYDPEFVLEILDDKGEVLVTTVILTVAGVPIGYILNQIHHVWIWVVRVNWDYYFEKELQLSEKFSDTKIGKYKELRYKYLLTRIHELGGILVSITINIILAVCNLVYIIKNNSKYALMSIIVFFIVLLIIGLVILVSRNYYQKNLDAFTKELASYDSQEVKDWFWFLKNK